MKIQMKIFSMVLPISLMVALVMFLSQQNNSLTGQNLADQKTKTDSVISEPVKQALIVSPQRCRGCGRCVMIDPEHFQMNGRTAVAISQENLTSSKLLEAIRFCPAGAIKVE